VSTFERKKHHKGKGNVIYHTKISTLKKCGLHFRDIANIQSCLSILLPELILCIVLSFLCLKNFLFCLKNMREERRVCGKKQAGKK